MVKKNLIQNKKGGYAFQHKFFDRCYHSTLIQCLKTLIGISSQMIDIVNMRVITRNPIHFAGTGLKKILAIFIKTLLLAFLRLYR